MVGKIVPSFEVARSMPQEAYCYTGVINVAVLKKYQASSPFPDKGGGGGGNEGSLRLHGQLKVNGGD